MLRRTIGVLVGAVALGGCHLLIGYRDAVLDEEEPAPEPACTVNGARDEAETGVDCGGGLCPACPDGEGCEVGTDCASLVCSGGTCRAPRCDDGVRNGAEVGVDCGGPGSGCSLCGEGAQCGSGADCESGVCKSGECVSYHLWSTSFYSSDELDVPGLAAGPSGEVVLSLSYSGVLHVGDQVLSTGTDRDFAIAKFDASGQVAWAATYGDGADQLGTAISLDPAGDLLLGGGFEGSVALDSTLTSAGSSDVLLAKLSSAGDPVWARRFGDAGMQAARSITGDTLGRYVITGDMASTLNFGDGPLTAQGDDAFAACFTDSGTVEWSVRFGGSGTQQGLFVVPAPDGGTFVVGGNCNGSVQIGPFDLVSNECAGYYIARLDPQGVPLWAKSMVTTQTYGWLFVTGASAGAGGDLFITGWTNDPIDIDGELIDDPPGPPDIFLMKFHQTGALLWSRWLGGNDGDGESRAAVDPGGNLVIAGLTQGGLDLGAGPLPKIGAQDLFVAKLTPDGDHVWSRSFGCTSQCRVTAVAAHGAERVAVSGMFTETLDLGGEPLITQGVTNAFVGVFQLP